MKTRIRWLVVASLGAAAVALLTFLFWPRPLEVTTAAIVEGPIAETVADQGTARVRQTFVVAAPVTGRLERLPIEVGDRVDKEATVIACIRPALPELLDPRVRAQADAAVQSARAALASAVAQRDRAAAEAARLRDQLRRTSELAQSGVVAPQEFENVRADADASANALRAADADIAIRRANLAAAEAALSTPRAGAAQLITVTAPASGIVTRVLQQSERPVTAGTQLAEISDPSGLEAAIEFLSQDAVKIRPGMRAAVYDWGGEGELPAVVRLVEPIGFTKVSALGVEEQRTLVYLTMASVDRGRCGLAPGYRVWGRVYLREQPHALLVPIGALVRDSGHWAVYRLEQGRAHLRAITIGTLTDREAEVLSGAAADDQVIAYPSDEIRDGVRVRPR